MIDIFKKIPKIILFLIFLSAILWNFQPIGLSKEGWHLLVIFISTIISIIDANLSLPEN